MVMAKEIIMARNPKSEGRNPKEGGSTAEIRNPKAEGRKKAEPRNPKPEAGGPTLH
jgi:hypothetical protein